MSEEAIQKELARLGRKVRNTRVGGVLGLGLLGVGVYYGARHLGEQHHQVFSELYRQHKTPVDPRPWTERARENLPQMPTINFPKSPLNQKPVNPTSDPVKASPDNSPPAPPA